MEFGVQNRLQGLVFACCVLKDSHLSDCQETTPEPENLDTHFGCKADLTKSKDGRIVSKKRQANAKKAR